MLEVVGPMMWWCWRIDGCEQSELSLELSEGSKLDFNWGKKGKELLSLAGSNIGSGREKYPVALHFIQYMNMSYARIAVG